MTENHIRILCSVIKVDLVYEAQDGSLVAFFDSIKDSPLMQCNRIREDLRTGSAGQKAPCHAGRKRGKRRLRRACGSLGVREHAGHARSEDRDPGQVRGARKR